MPIDICTPDTVEEWLSLRRALWPHPENEHRQEITQALQKADAIAFLAREESGAAIGFAEATLRHDYVNGCTTSPVGFLEGLYVHPGHRRRGVARALCRAVERWAQEHGCSELASDTWLDYIESQRMHAALGFDETERVVYFRKPLKPGVA